MENENIITCKHYNSKAISKYGKYKNTQLYWCKVCQRKFKGDDALFHMKVSPSHISLNSMASVLQKLSVFYFR